MKVLSKRRMEKAVPARRDEHFEPTRNAAMGP